MADTTRTFVALAIPDDRRAKLGRLQSLVAPEMPGTRWIDPSQFHATLAFLGDVPHADLGKVCKAVGGACADRGPLDLRLEGLGVFPDAARPRVAWVGLTGPDVEELKALRAALVEAVGHAGYPPDDDRFHPHVTLGRLHVRRDAPPPAGLDALLRHYHLWSAGSFRVAEVLTYSSTLTPEGPLYTPIARAPLVGGKVEASP